MLTSWPAQGGVWFPFWPPLSSPLSVTSTRLLEAWNNEYAVLGYGAHLYEDLFAFCELTGIKAIHSEHETLEFNPIPALVMRRSAVDRPRYPVIDVDPHLGGESAAGGPGPVAELLDVWMRLASRSSSTWTAAGARRSSMRT